MSDDKLNNCQILTWNCKKQLENLSLHFANLFVVVVVCPVILSLYASFTYSTYTTFLRIVRFCGKIAIIRKSELIILILYLKIAR